MSYECKICNTWFNEHISFSNHIKKTHNISIQTYYDTYLKQEGEGICKHCGNPTKYYGLGKGYSTYCSSKCSNAAQLENNTEATIQCAICNANIPGKNAQTAIKLFASHLKKEHNIYDAKIYYDTFVKHDDEGICPYCKGETKFKGVLLGYSKYCCTSCQQNHQKNIEGSHTNNLHVISSIRQYIAKIAANITEKYENFIKTDRHAQLADIRTDAINVKTVKETKTVNTADGVSEIKTEITSSTQQSPWLGTQHRYVPKLENCEHPAYQQFNDDIIEDDNINTNEWC